MPFYYYWFIFAFICAIIAPTKNRNPAAWFFFGFLLAPFALIAIICYGPLQTKKTSSEMPALP